MSPIDGEYHFGGGDIGLKMKCNGAGSDGSY